MQSLAAIRASLDRGEQTASEIVDACLKRIEQWESSIHAWAHLDSATARARAQELDGLARGGATLGPLHGIPLGVKDIVDVAGLPTLAGSPLRTRHVATTDAPMVARLRAAGAIILGKTVTTPWACFDPSPTRNPWNVNHTPGGSSSGSAAAVSLEMCAAAIGSQTGGSIVRPAAYCGVVGFKPSWGAIPADGVVPVSRRLDHLGFLARSASDCGVLFATAAELALDAAKTWWLRSTTAPMPPTIGVICEFYWRHADDAVRSATEAAMQKLAVAGATLRDVAPPADHDRALIWHQAIMAYEAAEYHRSMYLTHRDQYGPRMRELLDEGGEMDPAIYREACDGQSGFRDAVQACLSTCDAILTPATPTAAPADLTTTGSAMFNKAWSYAGVPAVSTPCGLTQDGLPVAIQLIGRHGGDRELLQIATWCEDALRFDMRPQLASATET